MPTTFPLSYSPKLRWLFVSMGMGPARSGVKVGDGAVEVHMGWSFRARLDSTAVRSAVPYTGRVLNWGAHGWRHRWLVNGSSKGIVVLTLDPPQRGSVLGVPITLTELRVSVEDPDGLIAALSPHGGER